MSTLFKVSGLADVIVDQSPELARSVYHSIPNHWHLRQIQSEDCLSYVAWNSDSQEAILVDPKTTDIAAYTSIYNELTGYRWLGIIDTHTHADHISVGAQLAHAWQVPLIMSAHAPSQRVDIRIARHTFLNAAGGPIRFVLTPGHTADSLTVFWGPFIFGGDTILFGDVGRDDLPGGSPAQHFESVEAIKQFARPEMILLPGHDHKGGRCSNWAHQLLINASLTQDKSSFIAEAQSFEAPAPKLLKESLRENFK